MPSKCGHYRVLHPLASAASKQVRRGGCIFPVFRDKTTQARWWSLATRTHGTLRYYRPDACPPWVDVLRINRNRKKGL